MPSTEQEIWKQAFQELKQKYNNENETIEDLDAEIKKQKLKMKDLKKFAKVLGKECTNNLQTLIKRMPKQKLEKKKEKYINNLQTLISEIAEQENEKQKYIDNLQVLRNNILTLKEEKKEKETKSLSKNLQNEITKEEKYLKDLDIEIKSQKEKNTNYQRELETLTNKIQNQVEKKQKLENQLKDCQDKSEKVDELEKQLTKIKKIQNDILNFENNQDKLQNQLVNIKELPIIKNQPINFETIVEIEQLINKVLQEQKILNQSEQSPKNQESIQNDQKILNLCFIVIELQNIKNDLEHSTNNEELEASIATLAVENNVNPKENKKGWTIRSFFKPLTNFISSKKQKLTINYYQKQEKRLTTEIRKLEAGKLKDFWNKFWLVVSCGCYNNHGKAERKIKEKKLELAEVKKQLEKFNVIVDSENNYNEPQPSTSLTTTNKSKTWNNKIKKEIENISSPKEKSKNLSSTLN